MEALTISALRIRLLALKTTRTTLLVNQAINEFLSDRDSYEAVSYADFFCIRKNIQLQEGSSGTTREALRVLTQFFSEFLELKGVSNAPTPLRRHHYGRAVAQ